MTRNENPGQWRSDNSTGPDPTRQDATRHDQTGQDVTNQDKMAIHPAKLKKIEERRNAVAKEYLQGHRSCREIARAVGCSPETARSDLAFLRKEWRERREVDFATALEEEISELDLVAKTAWHDYWSKPNAVRTKTKTVDGKPEVETTEECRARDPRYLEIAKDAVVKRSQLRGLLIERRELTIQGEFRVAGESADEVNKRMLERLISRVQQRHLLEANGEE